MQNLMKIRHQSTKANSSYGNRKISENVAQDAEVNIIKQRIKDYMQNKRRIARALTTYEKSNESLNPKKSPYIAHVFLLDEVTGKKDIRYMHSHSARKAKTPCLFVNKYKKMVIYDEKIISSLGTISRVNAGEKCRKKKRLLNGKYDFNKTQYATGYQLYKGQRNSICIKKEGSLDGKYNLQREPRAQTSNCNSKNAKELGKDKKNDSERKICSASKSFYSVRLRNDKEREQEIGKLIVFFGF